ncbi:hypothetical protein BJ138DRAFT_1101295 [Hygrophoropsis aurantiaca]|uniref:Uncharacterized protein n=1 Tax=Hygrophoropsis aurantiaca TaxID=72124 RepID=A0ACB8ADH3_9AGAM|nr:hypothetical protein BJ138DRAFT_1101295 [Hygrophoropsis aurantiaca]
MHRRVVAAVVPQTWRGHKPWNPDSEGAIPEEGDAEQNATTLGKRSLNYDIEANIGEHSRISRPLRRKMSSPGNSSVLSGSSLDDHERLRRSPESMRGNSLGSVPEEHGPNVHVEFPQFDDADPENDPEDDEWELQENGLYSGSYSRFVVMYSFVPATAVITFVILGLLPTFVWPIPSSLSRYPPGFPSPLPEILISGSLFSLAHILRVPFFSFASFLLRPQAAALLSTFLHVLLTNVLRLAALGLLQVRHFMDYPFPTWQDPSFRTVWWLAFNIAEVVVAIIQAYEQISLYRDVMIPEGRAHEFLERLKNDNVRMSDVRNPYSYQDPIRQVLVEPLDVEEDAAPITRDEPNEAGLGVQVDHDFDQLLAFKTREELEELYGVPIVQIPVFISCLQRFNSILLSVGLTLLLSSSYLRSPLSFPPSDHLQKPSLPNSNTPFFITFPLVLLVHTSLAMLYTPAILPRIGVQTAAYVGILAGLMSFFAGLAVWGALS